MADKGRGGGGFDDWLDEEPGPDTDPYAALADDTDDDAAAEISDWVAFTEGETIDDSDETAEVAVVATEESEPEPEEPVTDDAEPDDPEPDEPADDLAVPEARDEDLAPEPEDDDVVTFEPATSVEFAEFDGGDRADTDEIPIVSAAPVVDATVTNLTEVREDADEIDSLDVDDDDHDDTGELEVIVVDDETDEKSDIDTGELHVAEADVAAAGSVETDDDDDGDGSFDVMWDDDDHEEFELSDQDYLHTATKEHQGLAAAIALADDEATEQVALAAPIPGLESTVVGFEDVVEAEGHGRVWARKSGDLLARAITGLVLIGGLAAALVWRPALVVLATAVFVVGAGEFYTALARAGRKPVSIFGFIGVIGASIGAYLAGAIAIPAALVLATLILLLYFAVVPTSRDPLESISLTVAVMVWASLGAFALLIANSDDYRPLIVGVVVAVAAMDTAQYFVGRSLGRHKLSPWVSPNKTVEGLVGGVVVAFGIGALLHFVKPFELDTGLVLGAAVAVLVPLGDLAMSAAKRTLSLKDMGSILPGHGGFMDRIDGLLFVIPAAWAIFIWAGLL